MKTVAVVPVKSLHEAKSRLSGVLSGAQRSALMVSLLRHVLDTLRLSGAVDEIAVISPTAEGLGLPPGVAFIRQDRVGLNNLLEQGREWAASRGAGALMVIFADLPLVSPREIVEIVALGQVRGTAVLAPDRHGSGTNVLLASPPALARFAFGTDSYRAHQALHREAGAHVETYISTGTSLDLDTPDDLDYLECERYEAANA